MIISKAQIVATIGPASESEATLRAMMQHQMDVIRFNFSWGDLDERVRQVALIRKLEKECGKRIPLIVDLPGPRVQDIAGHTYDHETISAITSEDEQFIKFACEHDIDYVAVSFVGGAEDIRKCRSVISKYGGTQMIIAKIERKAALDLLGEIIVEADAFMVARGDLGNEVPLEAIPFIQDKIIKHSRKAGKPVIVATQMLISMEENPTPTVATQMLISMEENPTPTRAEVTDVANAILQGADAVMLSEETAKGAYPVEAVAMMEKIVLEAEKHLSGGLSFNHLKCIE